MKYGDLLIIKKGLNEFMNLDFTKISVNTDLLFAVMKNDKKVEEEIELLQKLAQERPDYIKYRQERLQLLKKYADKDENGEPIIEKVNVGGFMDDAYKIVKKLSIFKKESAKLDKKFKETIDSRQKQVKEYTEFMEKDVDFELEKVDKKLIPKKGLSPAIVDAFLLMV